MLAVACWVLLGVVTRQAALAGVLAGGGVLACGFVPYRRHRGRYRQFRRPQGRVPLERPGQGPRFFPPAMREYIFRRDGYRCTNCGSRSRLEADHIVPYSLGGKTVPSNGKTLCHDCNDLKGNRFSE
jgi:5-methylcytosine-specific restriction endonuclease McrA